MNYDEIIGILKDAYATFITEAEMGKEGKRFKSHSLKARKASTDLANKLKDYRALSIKNDKEEKPTNEEECCEEEVKEVLRPE